MTLAIYLFILHLTRSPLCKIIDHSNTALWTIPKFDLGDFPGHCLNKVYNILYIHEIDLKACLKSKSTSTAYVDAVTLDFYATGGCQLVKRQKEMTGQIEELDS